MNNNAEIINEVRAAFVAMFNDVYDTICGAFPDCNVHDMDSASMFRRIMEWQENQTYSPIHERHGFKQVGKGAARVGFEYTMKNGTVVAVKTDYRSNDAIENDRIGNAFDMMNHEAVINRFPDAKELLVETHGSFEVYDTLVLVQEKLMLGVDYDSVYRNEENKLRRQAIADMCSDINGNEWNYGYNSDNGIKAWREFIVNKHLVPVKKPRAPRKPRIKKLTPVEV